MEIEDLVREIMTVATPFPPCSVQCNFEDGSDEIRTVHETFDFFMTMVCHAFRIRCGDENGRVSFGDVSPELIYDMQERFKCLGFTFSLREATEDELPHVPGTRVHYDKDDIEACRLLLWNYGSDVPSAYVVGYVGVAPPIGAVATCGGS